jgi:hypothetical protein
MLCFKQFTYLAMRLLHLNYHEVDIAQIRCCPPRLEKKWSSPLLVFFVIWPRVGLTQVDVKSIRRSHNSEWICTYKFASRFVGVMENDRAQNWWADRAGNCIIRRHAIERSETKQL